MRPSAKRRGQAHENNGNNKKYLDDLIVHI